MKKTPFLLMRSACLMVFALFLSLGSSCQIPKNQHSGLNISTFGDKAADTVANKLAGKPGIKQIVDSTKKGSHGNIYNFIDMDCSGCKHHKGGSAARKGKHVPSGSGGITNRNDGTPAILSPVKDTMSRKVEINYFNLFLSRLKRDPDQTLNYALIAIVGIIGLVALFCLLRTLLKPHDHVTARIRALPKDRVGGSYL